MKSDLQSDPLISIITVNFNQGKVTHELLLSIEQLTYKNVEVIIVDNGSKEELSSQLFSSYNILEVKILKSETNLGFAGGNNLGISASRGDFLYFVNNDTELAQDSILPLLQRFASDPNIGIISPKIKYHSAPSIIQYAGYSPIRPLTGRNYGIGHKEKDKGQHNVAKVTNYAHGAAMMIKREILSTVGLMPEVFFLYYEELDWSEQIKRAGYKIYYEPESSIYHKESISVGKNSTLKTYYLTRNRILFMRRNFQGLQLCAFLLSFSFIALPKNLLQFLFRYELSHVKAFLKGYFWNVKQILRPLN